MTKKHPNVQFYPQIYDLRPWYHNFDKLGIQTDFGDMKMDRAEQLRRLLLLLSPFKPSGYVEKGEKFSLQNLWHGTPNSHQINQRHKEAYLIPFLQQAFANLPNSPTCLDLFCADGYYSCLISQQYPTASITAVDLDEMEIHRAQTAASILNLSSVNFQIKNVWEAVQTEDSYDLIFCAGGLYHLTEPQKLVEALSHIGTGYLIVQSVVTMETETADYFISPAPGWKHGSRFTHAGLKQWLETANWQIVSEARNELTGNPHLWNRGSSYFLCRRK